MAQPSSLGQPSLLLPEQDLEPENKWEEIGRGSFAIVYKAYCRVHNGYVAVKKELKESNQIKEIQKLVKLSNHDHVVTIKGHNPKKNYIIMEYCSYSLKSLRETLGKSFIPWPRCLNFMQHISNGLAYVHRENITHRDIQPGNVMVTDTFVCKIADLGLAKQQESFSNSRANSNIARPSGSLFLYQPRTTQGSSQTCQ